jgi:hypothetical protein
MSSLFITVSAIILVQVSALLGQKVDLRNYVIGGYDANPNEMRVAQERARRYWQKNGKRYGENVRYLGIEAATVMPGDVIQPLWGNMINAQTGSGFLLPSEWNPGRMRCVMIFDTQTSNFATRRGFLVIENPHRGTLAITSPFTSTQDRSGNLAGLKMPFTIEDRVLKHEVLVGGSTGGLVLAVN